MASVGHDLAACETWMCADGLRLGYVRSSRLNSPHRYRPGLLHRLAQGLDWDIAGRIVTLTGAIRIDYAVTQLHRLTPDEFAARVKEGFGFGYY